VTRQSIPYVCSDAYPAIFFSHMVLGLMLCFLSVSAPDKFTFPTLLPLSAPSASAFSSLMGPQLPAGPRPVLPNIYEVKGPVDGRDWPQGPIAKMLGADPALIELLKAVRAKFEESEPHHRIVDRCFGLVIHSTMTLEEAGPAPGAPPVEADGEEKKDGGKDAGKKKK
jgi:hypothetical protein